MNDHIKRMSQVLSDKPVGTTFTKIGNTNKVVDEAGRPYEIMSMVQKQRKIAEGYKLRDKRNFSFAHMRHIRDITDNLTNKTCGYILMLQPHIEYKTNILVTIERDPKPLTKKELSKVFNVTPRTVQTILTHLEENDVIQVMKNGSYKMNDRYHFRRKAKGDAEMLIKTFHTELRKLKLAAAEFGFIYKLLPYVHYESNLICADPFEEDPRDVKFLNMKQIAEIAGLSENKASEVLVRLEKSRVVAVMRRRSIPHHRNTGDNGKEYLTFFNPDIIYRQKGECTDVALLQTFRS